MPIGHDSSVRWIFACLLWIGCGTSRFELRTAPEKPFDVVIVPGCPSEEGGRLSRCQMSRALWAARLWERKWAQHFITSGSAVHSPYVEAEALAAALAALGVPPDRIYLESNALHTDENMFYSLQIARAQGFRTVAVASDGAAWGCLMLRDWGQDCRSFTIDRAWVRARHQEIPGVLEKIVTPPARDFVPLKEREREIARRTGRHRPPSYMLYLGIGILRLNGERWIPSGMPTHPARITWADHLAQN